MNDKPVKPSVPPAATDKLLGDIRNMIKEARAAVAATVNAGLTMLYWRIGSRINQEVLREERGDHWKQILATLWNQSEQDQTLNNRVKPNGPNTPWRIDR